MPEIKDTAALLASLALEHIEVNIFRGQNHDIGANHVFGGQVLSQALNAAQLTIPDDRFVHSMHAYFILAGDLQHPVVYDVDRVRDGGSFSTRRVRAVQHGQDIFVSAISFQKDQEGLDHQIDMPSITPPEDLLSDHELLLKYKDKLPKGLRRFLQTRPIEFRPVDPLNFVLHQKQNPERFVWFRAKGSVPEDRLIHQRLLAYASDYNLLTTAIQPHQGDVQYGQLQIASLDHAMWYHRSFKMDDWLLYAVDSPSASNARGFTRGNIFDKKGKLVASVVQEGLMRKKRE